jgi:hypothetical protein
VKQRQHPVVQLHSEQRHLQQALTQQYHSPVVVHPVGHPPPASHDLQVLPMLSHGPHGEVQYPPEHEPHPEQTSTVANAALLPVSTTPIESAAAVVSLKNPRREDCPDSQRDH